MFRSGGITEIAWKSYDSYKYLSRFRWFLVAYPLKPFDSAGLDSAGLDVVIRCPYQTSQVSWIVGKSRILIKFSHKLSYSSRFGQLHDD